MTPKAQPHQLTPLLLISCKEGLKEVEEGVFKILCSKSFHSQHLGYKANKGAPKNQDYYYVALKDRLILNWVDCDKAEFFHPITFKYAVDTAVAHIQNNQKVVIACDQGKSRSVGLSIAVMISLGKLPKNFKEAISRFMELYPNVDMGAGIEGRLKDWIYDPTN